MTAILVARTLNIRQELCKRMWNMPTIQNRLKPISPIFKPVEEAISTRPFAHCSMDLITDLPLVDRSDALLVVVDQGLSKGVILCPTNKTVDMDGIGELLHKNLYK